MLVYKVLAVNCLFNYFLELSVLCVHTLIHWKKRKTFNFDLLFECRGLLEKKKQVIIKPTSVNISRVYF